MNRREALAALVAMPNVARIAAVPANSTDVIVVECDSMMTMSMHDRLSEQLQAVWPDRKIVVLDHNIRLKVAPQ